MDEKTFEEKFPSLKLSGLYHIEHLPFAPVAILKDDVEQFCLDKQKVKDAIIEVAKECCEEHLLNTEDSELGLLWKKLRLDGEKE